jgi:hypothetical protein
VEGRSAINEIVKGSTEKRRSIKASGSRGKPMYTARRILPREPTPRRGKEGLCIRAQTHTHARRDTRADSADEPDELRRRCALQLRMQKTDGRSIGVDKKRDRARVAMPLMHVQCSLHWILMDRGGGALEEPSRSPSGAHPEPATFNASLGGKRCPPSPM